MHIAHKCFQIKCKGNTITGLVKGNTITGLVKGNTSTSLVKGNTSTSLVKGNTSTSLVKVQGAIFRVVKFKKKVQAHNNRHYKTVLWLIKFIATCNENSKFCYLQSISS